MVTRVYNGKEYTESSEEGQQILASANIYTFRFWPKESLHMLSDALVEYYHCDKFYEGGYDFTKKMLVYKADWDKYVSLYERAIAGVPTISENVRTRDGERYMRVQLTVLERDELGVPVLIGGLIEPCDENMKQAALAQMLSDDYYSILSVDFERDEVTPYRLADVIQANYGNSLVEKPSYKEIIGKYINQDVIVEEREQMTQVTSWENLNMQLKLSKSFRYDYHIIRDGLKKTLRMKVVRLDDEKKLTRAVIGYSDVTFDAQDRWNQIAYIDPITGGRNYNYYSEKLKDQNEEGYVVSLDIRSFKLVNSVCGIATGDNVLKEASRIITGAIDGRGFYGHVNADHFVFFLNVKTEEEVVAVMKDITKQFEDMVDRLEIPRISPYFGATRWKNGSRNQVTFSEANTAKHRIKDSKGLNYGFYRDEDTAAAIEKKAIEDSFDEALRKKEFVVWYQPKYNPGGDMLTGAEALIRWKKPSGEMISPGKFIPIYENNGMIRQLDAYVFEQVCRQQKEWIEKVGRTVPVSVNLSRASLYTENIVDEYKAIAEKIGILPELVPIEITESAAVDNVDIKKLADSFFEAGFPLHIDDFGTGYSSLSTLNLMRFDTLKLDKSLVDYIGEFGGDRLIKHTVALAKDLGLSVTAEGVEKEEQVSFLKKVDCDNIQGFFYSRPMPADFFAEKLQSELISEKCLYRKGQQYTYPVILEACKRACNHDGAKRIEGETAIQFNIVGEGAGSFYVRIHKGEIDIQPYEYYDHNALLTLHADVLLDMIKGRITLENAYRSGLVQVEGDWGSAILLTQIVRKTGE